MENVKNNSHFSKYLSHASIENLFDLINSGQKRINISGLKGSSGHLLISMLSEIGKYILYVSSSKEKAEANSVNLTAIKGLEIPVYSSKDLNKSRSLFEKQNLEELNRIDSLHKINQTNILCTDIISIFELIAPSDIIQNSVYELKVGNDIERVKLINLLKKLGYTELDFVERKSEFSIRGSVVDIYSVGYNNPYRVEFFGDSINSIREFNTSTQKSVNKVERVKINPASFIIIENNKLNSVLENLNYAAEKNGLTARDKNFLFESIKSNIKINDIEWFTPYFYSKKETILDYFKNDLLIIFDEDFNFESIIQDQEKRFFNSTRIGGKFKDLIPDFKELYISEDQLSERLEKHKIIKLGILNNKTETTIKYDTEKINIEENIIESLSQLINELKSKNYELYIYSYSQSEKEKLKSLLNDNNIDNINYLIGPLDNGFVFNDLKIAFISENDISNKKESKPKNLSKFTDIPSVFITSFSDLKPGDYIVHKEFGIGIFKGLKKLTFNSKQGDFIECEYKDKDKIYVPVEKLKLIQRYIGDSKNPSIEKLGSDNWKRTVKRVKKAVETIAKDLLELYAKRKMEKGYMFSPRDQIFNEFELAFPYNETRDQAKSIEEVMQDMESEKPMDRLICGDVGFGKTEIALRAAFKASMDGKQVLLLAPTTLLVNQHYQNALKRLSEYPIEVDMLSRFRTKREENEIIKKIENGSLDIIIGTHKLLNSKIIFKNLGLIIIDEEQKFGVKHKEYLRALKSGIDVLTLSATPIPRTLQLSLTDIRDISLIITPPEGRIPVEVYIQTFNPDSIREAVLNEIQRSGKVFFIHNRIEDIFETAEILKDLIPEANIAVTHGRMNEKTLEKTLKEFIDGEVNLLVTTAIVESGLDIPMANTIIVNNAHTFGLADLYQLKGRVGRSNIKAYSYFLIPSLNTITTEARRRLEVLSELTDLGSGFKLALSDLEIRGAGNLFGKEQSGHIANIGLEFYLELLKNTINELKNKGHHFDYEPEIKTNENAFIPDWYIESSSQRLFYYKKISSIRKNYEIDELNSELKDKFGVIPPELIHLLKLSRLRILLKEAFIGKIEILKDYAVLSFLDISPYSKMFMPGKKLKIYFNSGDKYKILSFRINELIKGKIKQ